jgi:hypothetical protein
MLDDVRGCMAKANTDSKVRWAASVVMLLVAFGWAD